MSRAWKCSSQARVWMRWLWDGVLVDRSTGRRPKRLGPGRRGPVGGGRSTGRVTGRRQNSTDRHLLPSDALLSKHAMSRHFPPEALSLSFFVRWSVWFVFFGRESFRSGSYWTTRKRRDPSSVGSSWDSWWFFGVCVRDLWRESCWVNWGVLRYCRRSVSFL